MYLFLAFKKGVYIMKCKKFLGNVAAVLMWLFIIGYVAFAFLKDPMAIVSERGVLAFCVFLVVFAFFAVLLGIMNICDCLYEFRTGKERSVFRNMSREEKKELMQDLHLRDDKELIELFDTESAITDRGRVGIMDLLQGDRVETDFGAAKVVGAPYISGKSSGYTVFIPVDIDGNSMACSADCLW